jgi:RNA recognition motif-containing protein
VDVFRRRKSPHRARAGAAAQQQQQQRQWFSERRRVVAASSSRRPESVEVTTPRLYVGNLSFEATESDLFELFNGVGQVQNAEVVTYKHNQRRKASRLCR